MSAGAMPGRDGCGLRGTAGSGDKIIATRNCTGSHVRHWRTAQPLVQNQAVAGCATLLVCGICKTGSWVSPPSAPAVFRVLNRLMSMF